MKTHVVVIGYLILSDHICFINYYTSYKLENTKKKRFYRIYIYIYQQNNNKAVSFNQWCLRKQGPASYGEGANKTTVTDKKSVKFISMGFTWLHW